MPRVLPKLTVALVVSALLLGIPELVLRSTWEPPAPERPVPGTRRFVEWLERLSIPTKDPGLLYREDPERLWILRAGATLDSFNYHAATRELATPIRITVNADGYRGPAAARTDATRVVCMGDSNFFGYPLDDRDVFPAALQRALDGRADGPFEVLNGGVPGYTIEQGLRWFRATFRALAPDVVLLSYLNNDAWEQPQTDAELLARSAAPFAGLRRALGQLRVLQYLVAHRSAPAAAPPTVPRVPLERFLTLYGEFLDEARTLGADVVVLDYRAYQQIEPYSDALRQLCARRGAAYLFVGSLLKGAITSGALERTLPELVARARARWGEAFLAQHDYLAGYAEFHPEHLNEAGAEFLARRVAKLVRRGASIPK
jgi:lysophospholipase L1-like esterase